MKQRSVCRTICGYGEMSFDIKFTGPVNRYDNLWLYTDRAFAYADTCQDEMTIEYTDGAIVK